MPEIAPLRLNTPVSGSRIVSCHSRSCRRMFLLTSSMTLTVAFLPSSVTMPCPLSSTQSLVPSFRNYPIADIILPFLPSDLRKWSSRPVPSPPAPRSSADTPCRLHELFIGITEIIQHRIIDNIEGQSSSRITSGNPSGSMGKHNFHQFPAGHGIQFSH